MSSLPILRSFTDLFFVEEHLISTQQTRRYYTLGEINDQREQEVWVVLHGYGQLAQYFIRKFERLVQEGAAIVAPEGSALFYLNGTQGRVGATWMTREFREQAILNYVAYLQHIYLALKLHRKRLVLLGFSQGGSTLIRWVVHHNISFDKLILWAGTFPPDVDAKACHRVLSEGVTYYVYGDQDEYITPERVNEQQALFAANGFNPEVVRFSGRHTIDEDVLRVLQQKKLP